MRKKNGRNNWKLKYLQCFISQVVDTRTEPGSWAGGFPKGNDKTNIQW